MMDIYPDSHCPNAIQTYGKDDTNTTLNIQQQLTQLTTQLASLQDTFASIHLRPNKSISRKRSVSRQRPRSPKGADGICWYLLKYGKKPRRCTQSWNFTTNNNEKQGNGPVRQ
ncbi:unnamed protein product [Schistosoma curassoni]|uniref:Uncharacterized protein n=1 Tax=Schistosoma curassoni TaxID=6186 RepID=A0A183KBH5_9TREM|nr:unnamed protein product [Schistosoma curassoni]